jgi:hypothetical protein
MANSTLRGLYVGASPSLSANDDKAETAFVVVAFWDVRDAVKSVKGLKTLLFASPHFSNDESGRKKRWEEVLAQTAAAADGKVGFADEDGVNEVGIFFTMFCVAYLLTLSPL